jgi:hypothetical protein
MRNPDACPLNNKVLDNPMCGEQSALSLSVTGQGPEDKDDSKDVSVDQHDTSFLLDATGVSMLTLMNLQQRWSPR